MGRCQRQTARGWLTSDLEAVKVLIWMLKAWKVSEFLGYILFQIFGVEI